MQGRNSRLHRDEYRLSEREYRGFVVLRPHASGESGEWVTSPELRGRWKPAGTLEWKITIETIGVPQHPY